MREKPPGTHPAAAAGLTRSVLARSVLSPFFCCFVCSSATATSAAPAERLIALSLSYNLEGRTPH